METTLASLIVTTSDKSNVQSLFSTSSTELQAPPSSTKLDTLVLSTSILDSSGIFANVHSVSIVSIFTASPSMSTIVSIPSTKAISAMIVETKPQSSTKFLGKGKEMEEEIDLNEEIIIPNWGISKLNPDQM